ncbi:MAG: septum formation initiator family protein [Bacteroidales bacterium]|nr:septum formation initiator family protein [Bacteroidales bacterium]
MGRLLTFWNYVRRYKYVAAIAIFLLIIGVLDENSLYTRFQRRIEISNLKREINKYQLQYEAETSQLQALKNNPSAVERIARERYFMKRPDEDVFVFVTDSEQVVSQPPDR